MILGEEGFIFLLFVLQIDKCVLRTSNEYLWGCSVPWRWIKGNLKVWRLYSNWALLTDISNTYHLSTFPIPKNQFPVWLSCQSDDELVISWTKSTCHKLLWLISIWLLESLWQCFSSFLWDDFKDRELTFVSISWALTDTNVCSTFRDWDMSYCLSLLRTW